ncbi:MAG: hypothetical protein OSA98_21075 [Rubripirellula sp.]|nr:hypothetical protein [Rubripirellula sp.]
MTPSGFVIHAVAGPVSASELLTEASWAVHLYEELESKSPQQQAIYSSSLHYAASMVSISNKDRRIHELLSKNPLPRLAQIYPTVFKKILNEPISTAKPRLAQAAARLAYAKTTKRPLLFVLHEQSHQGYYKLPPLNFVTRRMIEEYVVIVMPLREAPALSQITNRPPYEATGRARPLIVAADYNGEPISTFTGWNQPNLNQTLARGWASAIEENPPSLRSLVRVQRVLRPIDPVAAERIKATTIRTREEAKAARKQEPQPKVPAAPNSKLPNAQLALAS